MWEEGAAGERVRYLKCACVNANVVKVFSPPLRGPAITTVSPPTAFFALGAAPPFFAAAAAAANASLTSNRPRKPFKNVKQCIGCRTPPEKSSFPPLPPPVLLLPAAGFLVPTFPCAAAPAAPNANGWKSLRVTPMPQVWSVSTPRMLWNEVEAAASGMLPYTRGE